MFALLPFLGLWSLYLLVSPRAAGDFVAVVALSVLGSGFVSALCISDFAVGYHRAKDPTAFAQTLFSGIGTVALGGVVLSFLAYPLFGPRFLAAGLLGSVGLWTDLVGATLRVRERGKGLLFFALSQGVVFGLGWATLKALDLLSTESLLFLLLGARVVGVVAIGGVLPKFRWLGRRSVTGLWGRVRRTGGYTGVDFALHHLVGHFCFYGLFLQGLSSTLGHLSAAQSLFRPILILLLGEQLSALPRWAKRYEQDGNFFRLWSSLRVRWIGGAVALGIWWSALVGGWTGIPLTLSPEQLALVAGSVGFMVGIVYLRGVLWLLHGAGWVCGVHGAVLCALMVLWGLGVRDLSGMLWLQWMGLGGIFGGMLAWAWVRPFPVPGAAPV